MSKYKRTNYETTGKLAEKYTRILGVRIDSTPKSGLLRKIAVDIRKGKKFHITTPNSEQILQAQSDARFKSVLDSSLISIPDSIGVVAADKYLRLPSPKAELLRFVVFLLQGIGVGMSIIMNRKWLERDLKVIRGREMFWDLVKLANKKGMKMFLLGGEGSEGLLTKKQIEKNYKNVIVKTRNGPLLDDEGKPRRKVDVAEERITIKEINLFKPDILIIGMTPPHQEKFLYRWYNKLDFHCAMLVGGTFKYVSGQRRFPPNFISNWGLEWMWRLLTGSQKWGRIYNAVVRFPLQVFRFKLRNNLQVTK